MKKKILFLISIILIVAILGIVIYKRTDSENVYEKTLITYLEAMKEGSSSAIAYTAFPNEVIEHDYLSSPVCIIDYEITSSTQINDNLCAFSLNIATTDNPSIYTPLYYFVGQQSGTHTVYINVNYVPEALRTNLNLNDFSYSNPNYLNGYPEFDNSTSAE